MDPISTLSLVANIIQVVSFGTTVVKRLEEYRSKTGDLPEAFKHISIKLPALLHKLKQTEAAANNGTIPAADRKVLMPILSGCTKEIQTLEQIIAKALPKDGDSGVKRGFKAVGSLRYDARVEKSIREIERYIPLLTYFAVATNNTTPLPRPSPGTTSPFPRDPHFVDRDVLTEVLARSQTLCPRLALVGLGGVGKSQIANEFTHRIRDISPDTWTFWVNADTLANFEKDYKNIAEMVGIVGWDDQDANIAKLVHTWLSNESNGNWIMVIDNADILDVFTSTPSNSVAKSTSMNITAAAPQLQDYIPSSRNGRILITSRDKDVAFHLTCSWPHILEVEPMSEAEATTLLASKLVVTSPPDHLIELVEALGHMPLAISQAAAYISQRTPRETIKTYLERLKKGDEEADKLLGTDVREAGRDRQRTNSIMSTWHITFQYVRKHKPSAARLLSLMCLFDRQRIPEALLEEEYTEDVVLSQPLKNVTWWKRRKNRLRGSRKQHTEKPKMNCNFDDDWLTLMNFSLIKTREGGRSFTMHRLVQFTTKKWLKMQGELDYWTKRYVVMLKYWLSPNPKLAIGKEFRMIYGMVFSHAQAALDYRPKDDKELLIWVELMYCAGHWADHAGNWTAEEMMSRGALEAIEGLRGADDEFSLKVAYQLGYAQHVLRKYEESEAIFRRVLEGRCKILEPDHVNIISSLASIGLVLAKQGKLQEAYEMYVRKLDAQERRFGLADSDIHDSTRELAFEFFTYGGYKQAAALQRRLLDRTKNALGIEDETGVFHLTMMLHMQGEYEEAEAICRQVIETRTEKFGGDSLNVAETRIKLGDALASQKRYPEAEEQYRQALQKYEIETGEGNYNTWACMQQLAEVLAKLGKYEEAERFSYRLIEGRERLEGKDHCDTFVAIHTLATVLNEQERYEEALILYKKAYEGTKKKVGENHDDTKEFLEDYCRVQGILDSQKLDVVVIESEQLHDSDNCSAKSILEETNELVLDCAHV